MRCRFFFPQVGTYHRNSSKDAVIRVWDRKTLELHRVLRGHEGPVNAVGLQNGRVVRLLTVPTLLFFSRTSSR